MFKFVSIVPKMVQVAKVAKLYEPDLHWARTGKGGKFLVGTSPESALGKCHYSTPPLRLRGGAILGKGIIAID